MEEPEQEVIRELVMKAVEACTDVDLLDLIFKLLNSICL